MARGVDGREVFIDDVDRRDFLAIALRLKTETPYSILAYCLMGNHFHFAIKVESTPLSKIMHRLLTTYVLGFNARHEREGHLFQARYKSFLCLDDAYLISLVRYIHMNPVRAGLAPSPGDWPWSSHRQYAGKAAAAIADTGFFFDVVSTREPNVRDYDRWATDADDGFKPWPETAASPPVLRDEPRKFEPLDELVSSLFPDDLAELKSDSRVRAVTRKRRLVAETAVRNGHSLVAIAGWMDRTPQAIHRLLRRNKLIKLKPDPNV